MKSKWCKNRMWLLKKEFQLFHLNRLLFVKLLLILVEWKTPYKKCSLAYSLVLKPIGVDSLP